MPPLTFDDWNLTFGTQTSACYAAAQAAWEYQQRRIDELEKRYNQTKIWAQDCICRCPIQEL